MNEQIEKLIEKYQKNYKEMRLEIPTGEIIKDLQSLQDTTQEREFCPLKPGEYMKDNFWNIITYEDLQKWVKPIYDSKSPESNRKHIIEDIC